MTGPKGNSEFCFAETLNTRVVYTREIIRGLLWPRLTPCIMVQNLRLRLTQAAAYPGLGF